MLSHPFLANDSSKVSSFVAVEDRGSQESAFGFRPPPGARSQATGANRVPDQLLDRQSYFIFPVFLSCGSHVVAPVSVLNR